MVKAPRTGPSQLSLLFYDSLVVSAAALLSLHLVSTLR